MSIGKNAIKRVENNGYSKVKTEAPDMVNSTVIGATDKQVIDMIEKQVAKNTTKKVAQTKSPTPKASTPKKATQKPAVKVTKLTPPTAVVDENLPKIEKPIEEVKTPVKTAKKKAENENGKTYAFGQELPVYLL